MGETTLNPAGKNPVCSTSQWYPDWDDVHDADSGDLGGECRAGVGFYEDNHYISRILMRFDTSGHPFPAGGSVRFEIKANSGVVYGLTPGNAMVCRCQASEVDYDPDPDAGDYGLASEDNYHVPTQAHGAVAIGTLSGNTQINSIWSVDIPAEQYQAVDGFYIGIIEKSHDWEDVVNETVLRGVFSTPRLVITVPDAAPSPPLGSLALLGVGR